MYVLYCLKTLDVDSILEFGVKSYHCLSLCSVFDYLFTNDKTLALWENQHFGWSTREFMTGNAQMLSFFQTGVKLYFYFPVALNHQYFFKVALGYLIT